MNNIDFKQLKLEDHKFTSYDKVRYSDTDKQGHVNNAVFSTFFETGRVELLYLPDHPLYDDGCEFVIASNKIDYLQEIKWPGQVQIGTSLSHLGNSSIHIVQSIYQNGVLAGLSVNVTVQIDKVTRKSKPFSDQKKEELKHYLF